MFVYMFINQSVASLLALGPWAPPAERDLSLESIYRVSLTVDLCEGNKIISLKKYISPQPVGAPQKEKNPGALGTCPVCPLVKTAIINLRTCLMKVRDLLLPIFTLGFSRLNVGLTSLVITAISDGVIFLVAEAVVTSYAVGVA